MSNDGLTSKIELLEEQIENLERSGFFTELEMDRATISLKAELDFYKLEYSKHTNAEFKKKSKPLYGMTHEDYADGMKIHNECFSQMPTNKNQN